MRRRRPIFPWGYPHSIIGAEELNCRVRDGNGCTLFARVTDSPAHPGVFLTGIILHDLMRSVKHFSDQIEKSFTLVGKLGAHPIVIDTVGK